MPVCAQQGPELLGGAVGGQPSPPQACALPPLSLGLSPVHRDGCPELTGHFSFKHPVLGPRVAPCVTTEPCRGVWAS